MFVDLSLGCGRQRAGRCMVEAVNANARVNLPFSEHGSLATTHYCVLVLALVLARISRIPVQNRNSKISARPD